MSDEPGARLLALEAEVERQRRRAARLEREASLALAELAARTREVEAQSALVALVTSSRSWRLTAPLRAAKAASLRLLAALRPARGEAVADVEGEVEGATARELRRARRLFAADWYAERHPEAAAVGDVFAHYLDGGAAAGRSPSPVFDAPWYAGQYPEARRGVDPLVDFVTVGAAAGRDPNRYFGTSAWFGEATLRGEELDVIRYLAGVAGGVTDPRASDVDASVVTAVRRGARPLREGSHVCVYAHFDPDGTVDAYVVRVLESLARAGTATVFVSSCASLPPEELAKVEPLVALAATTTNQGRDWGLYHAGLRLALAEARPAGVTLLNDSVYLCGDSLEGLLARAAAADADVVGATESFLPRYHAQSYFLHLRAAALETGGLVDEFLASYVPVSEKSYVIIAYEVGFSRRASALGLGVSAIWPYVEIERLAAELPAGDPRRRLVERATPTNQTHAFWDVLLRAGCPFLKVELLRDNPSRVGNLDRVASLVPRDVHAELDAHLARVAGRRESGRGRAR